MNNVLVDNINNLGLHDPVPQEEQIYVLSSSQLQEIIEKTTMKATESLEVRIAHLEENQLIQLRLIKGRKDPQPMQKDRGEILRALIAINGGKMLAKEARQKMHLSRSRFSILLSTMKSDIEVKPYHLKRNQKVLSLK